MKTKMNENENSRNENADVRRIRVIPYEAGEKESRTGTQKRRSRDFQDTERPPRCAGQRGGGVETDYRRVTYWRYHWNGTTAAIFYMSAAEKRPCGGSPETQRRHP